MRALDIAFPTTIKTNIPARYVLLRLGGTAPPAYDGNGNLTFDGSTTFAYCAENRLLSMTQAANPAIATNAYTYDAQGRRKTWSSGIFTDPSTGTTTSTLTRVYVTDADNREVLEYDGLTGQILRWYAYGQGPDAMLNEMNVATGSRATPIPDIQGSVIGSLDAASGALFKAGYLPFGENTASAAQPSGLYYYRARMYAPDLGRLLQPDRIGFAGGLNVYGYMGNDPPNAVNKMG